jgi:DNA invertase Pin-like site-specific DNA recombinase
MRRDGLVVAKLDRRSRSLIDFATLVERSRSKGWEIVVLDLNVLHDDAHRVKLWPGCSPCSRSDSAV